MRDLAKNNRETLLRKAIIFSFLFIIIPFGVMSVFLYRSMSAASVRSAEAILAETDRLATDALRDTAWFGARIYDIRFRDIITDLERLKRDIAEQGVDARALQTFLYAHPFIAQIQFHDATGGVSAEASLGEALHEVKAPSLSPTEQAIGAWVLVSEGEGVASLRYVVGVRREGTAIGTIHLRFDVTNLFQEILTVDPAESSYVFLARNDGSFISSSVGLRKDLRTEVGEDGIERITDSALQGQAFEWSGQLRTFRTPARPDVAEKLIAQATLPSLGGYLFIVAPFENLIEIQSENASALRDDNVRSGSLLTFLSAALALLVLLFAYWGLRFAILEPVARVKEAMRRFLSTRRAAPTGVRSNDELGDVAAYFEDMSRQLQGLYDDLESKVQERTVRLRGLLLQQRDFLSNAAHDLRSPLNHMRWSVELLRSGDAGPLTQEQKDVAEELHATSERLETMLQNIIETEQLNRGEIAVEYTEVTLPDIVDTVLGEYARRIADRHLILEWRRPRSFPNQRADKEKLIRILANLIDNSVKYTAPGGRIRVTVEQIEQDDAPSARIRISDTGIGIPAGEERERLFEKFFRASNVAERDIEGTGLGLYIVKELVELHGGTVEFESTVDKGTTFTVVLPLDPPPPSRRRGQRDGEDLVAIA